MGGAFTDRDSQSWYTNEHFATFLYPSLQLAVVLSFCTGIPTRTRCFESVKHHARVVTVFYYHAVPTFKLTSDHLPQQTRTDKGKNTINFQMGLSKESTPCTATKGTNPQTAHTQGMGAHSPLNRHRLSWPPKGRDPAPLLRSPPHSPHFHSYALPYLFCEGSGCLSNLLVS